MPNTLSNPILGIYTQLRVSHSVPWSKSKYPRDASLLSCGRLFSFLGCGARVLGGWVHFLGGPPRGRCSRGALPPLADALEPAHPSAAALRQISSDAAYLQGGRRQGALELAPSLADTLRRICEEAAGRGRSMPTDLRTRRRRPISRGSEVTVQDGGGGGSEAASMDLRRSRRI